MFSSDADAGTYVIVEYDGIHYPGAVEVNTAGEYLVNVMEPCRGGWRWPRRKDSLWYKDIVKTTTPPVPANSRGLFIFTDTI